MWLSCGQLHLVSTTGHTDVSIAVRLRQAPAGQVNVVCSELHVLSNVKRRFEYRWTAGHKGMLGRTHPARFLTPQDRASGHSLRPP